jgi:nucleoid DNA-binding protein
LFLQKALEKRRRISQNRGLLSRSGADFPVFSEGFRGRFRGCHGWFSTPIFAKESQKMAKTAAKPPTKSEVYADIAGATALTRKQVAAVFDALSESIKKSLKKGGIFAVPGLMKLVVIRKPAQPAKKGINPFTKQEQMFKAKPARNVIKIRALKSLKDMVK